MIDHNHQSLAHWARDQVRRFRGWRISVGGLTLTLLALALGALAFIGVCRARRSSAQPAELELAPFIESVRQQLEQVEKTRVEKGDPALFRLKDFDLELNFIVKSSTKGTGGLKTEVVTVGMDQEFGKELSQKIILHMSLAPAERVTIEEAAQPLSPQGGIPLPTVKVSRAK